MYLAATGIAPMELTYLLRDNLHYWIAMDVTAQNDLFLLHIRYRARLFKNLCQDFI